MPESPQAAPAVVPNIGYAPSLGEKGYGDLYLPPQSKNPRLILLIHGGGWNSMNRHRIQHVAEFFASLGYAVFNTSYRLTSEAPYPACEDDCLAAANFLLSGAHPSLERVDTSQLVVAGLSAGGHLALVTGLRLPRSQVAAILNFAGITDLNAPEVEGLVKRANLAHQSSDPQASLAQGSPTEIATGRALPPLLVTHCQQDKVVNVEQAYRIIRRWNESKATVLAYLYEGSEKRGHNFWRDDSPIPHLIPELQTQAASFLSSVYPVAPPPANAS